MTSSPNTPREESYREVVSRLATSQKSNRNAPGWSRWVNRPLGRRIAAWAYLRGLTPNQVTAISAVFTFAGLAAVFVMEPSWPMAVGVSLFLIAGYAFDSADGQLARLRGGGSALGEWLDHVTDCVKNVTVHLAVLVSWYRFVDLPTPLLLAVPAVFAVVASTFFFAMILTDQLRRVHGVPSRQGGSSSSARQPILPSLVVLPNDYGLLCVAFATLAWPTVFVPTYALLMLANLMFLAVGLLRWAREVRTF